MDEKKGILVYGASSSMVAPYYFEFARELGREIARTGYPLINGGGRGGLMAASTEGALELGGETIGVLPNFMKEKDWANKDLSRIIITQDMHERKKTMVDMSCGAIALPGGVGTLDELFELITWRELGLYKGNVVIVNAYGFYDRLLEHLNYAMDESFIMTKGLYTVAYNASSAVKAAIAEIKDFQIREKY